eukprot:Gb_29761 [translate_table: standard]
MEIILNKSIGGAVSGLERLGLRILGSVWNLELKVEGILLVGVGGKVKDTSLGVEGKRHFRTTGTHRGLGLGSCASLSSCSLLSSIPPNPFEELLNLLGWSCLRPYQQSPHNLSQFVIRYPPILWAPLVASTFSFLLPLAEVIVVPPSLVPLGHLSHPFLPWR